MRPWTTSVEARDGIPNATLEAAEQVAARLRNWPLRLGARFLVAEAEGRPDEYVLEQALEASATPEPALPAGGPAYHWADLFGALLGVRRHAAARSYKTHSRPLGTRRVTSGRRCVR